MTCKNGQFSCVCLLNQITVFGRKRKVKCKFYSVYSIFAIMAIHGFRIGRGSARSVGETSREREREATGEKMGKTIRTRKDESKEGRRIFEALPRDSYIHKSAIKLRYRNQKYDSASAMMADLVTVALTRTQIK